jgi:hypothetical protein
MGISWAIVIMLFFLTLSIAVAETAALREGTMTMILLVSLATGVVAFCWAYVKRDKWLRSTSTPTPGDNFQAEGQVHPSNAATPIRTILVEESPGLDSILRVSDSLLIRLQIPPELGITNQNIMDLAFKIYNGDLSWSRRALKNIIPENAYTEFSDILEGRGVLRNAPNKSFALTQMGVDLFCNVVVTGVPPPTTTAQLGLAG